MKNKTSVGLFWKLLERFGVSGVQFAIQIILARLLAPEHYGVLSIMIIFTSLANVFIQNGFNTSLIQNKDVTEEDYSSVFWISFIIAAVLYIIIYISAPLIGSLYSMPSIVSPLRVLTIILFPGALNSVQLAKITREMNFKKVFYSNIGAIVLSGILGIFFAFKGYGVWALVLQNLLNAIIACLIMAFTSKLKIKFALNIKRIKVLFSYGWKLLLSSLIDTLYQDLRSMIIGLKYNSGILGYYNRGKQFPQFIINAVNGAVQSVLLPAMSKKQDQASEVKILMRNSIMLSSYIIFPIMSGLAAVSTPLVRFLLTEKWLPCVPYMQIYCFTLAFYPVHSCNLQAINAMGRSDIFLKLEIIKKGIGIFALLIAVFCFDSPIAIAMTGVFTTFTSCFINAYPNKKLINYSYLEQIKDLVPSFLCSIIMCVIVLLLADLNLYPLFTLLLQVFIGITIYTLLSVMLKLQPFIIIKNMILEFIKRITNYD